MHLKYEILQTLPRCLGHDGCCAGGPGENKHEKRSPVTGGGGQGAVPRAGRGYCGVSGGALPGRVHPACAPGAAVFHACFLTRLSRRRLRCGARRVPAPPRLSGEAPTRGRNGTRLCAEFRPGAAAQQLPAGSAPSSLRPPSALGTKASCLPGPPSSCSCGSAPCQGLGLGTGP